MVGLQLFLTQGQIRPDDLRGHLWPHFIWCPTCQTADTARGGMACPHTRPDTELCSERATWGEAQGQAAPPDATFPHFYYSTMDGYGDTRMDNSQVSINKRNGDCRGPVPAQPHINNKTAEPVWRRRWGSRPHCPGQGTDTNTAGTQTTEARGPFPAPSHTPLPSEAPEILGVAGALHHSPAQVKSVSSVSIKTAGAEAGTCIRPLMYAEPHSGSPGGDLKAEGLKQQKWGQIKLLVGGAVWSRALHPHDPAQSLCAATLLLPLHSRKNWDPIMARGLP